MSYRLVIAPTAQREIQAFARRLQQYGDDFASEQLIRLSYEFGAYLAGTPLMWNYFFLTGAPYHGYLFRFGRRTQYWVVYAVREDSRAVEILRFWNAAQDPEALDL
jgi:hypothetical protein